MGSNHDISSQENAATLGAPTRWDVFGPDGTNWAGVSRQAYADAGLLPAEAPEHRVVSLDGWACDVCGQPVNGQTDADGTPTNRGDSVYHTPEAAQ